MICLRVRQPSGPRDTCGRDTSFLHPSLLHAGAVCAYRGIRIHEYIVICVRVRRPSGPRDTICVRVRRPTVVLELVLQLCGEPFRASHRHSRMPRIVAICGR